MTKKSLSAEKIRQNEELIATMRSPWRFHHIVDNGYWSFKLADHGVQHLDEPLSQLDVLAMFAWSKWLLRQYASRL